MKNSGQLFILLFRKIIIKFSQEYSQKKIDDENKKKLEKDNEKKLEKEKEKALK